MRFVNPLEDLEKTLMNKLLKVKCPQCSKMFLYYESEARPFCTERCKQIDLGHWFQETYVVPVKSSGRRVRSRI